MVINKNSRLIKPGVILLGFITLATQIITLREFLTFFNGNELVIGIILANWMLLTGLGAYLGRFIGRNSNREWWILFFLGILAFIPIVTVWLLHVVWYTLFPPGIMAGIYHVFYYSLVVLSPFCISSGILFTLFASEESIRESTNRIGEVYAWESLGSLVGGLILNFILIWISTTFQSLFLIMIAVVVITFYMGIMSNQYIISSIILFVFFLFGYYFLNIDLDKKVRELAFPSQEIEYIRDSPYGVFAVTKQENQLNYYENNILIASTGDIITKEESVHFAMVQHSNPKNVLVLSGIVNSLMEEIIKYPVTSIDYVDINPEVIKIARSSLNEELNQTIHLIEKDPIRFLKKNVSKYDVVLINLPKPSTIQLNRYYTREFFQLLKRNLNKDAVVSLSMPSSANYMSDEARRFLSIIYKTLNVEFENVLILPASDDFLLASDNMLDYRVAQKVEELNIPTAYVNTYYFDDQLLELRSKQLYEQIDSTVSLNTNFNPIFYQSQIKLWMSHFNIKYWIPALIILLFSGFFFFKAGAIYKGVYAAGFAGTTIEIVLLLVFQVVFGYIYAVVGIFIMVFMGGLAFGSFYVPKYFSTINRSIFKKLLLVIVVFSFLLPMIFWTFKSTELPDIVLLIIFALLILMISVLTGAVFSVASRISGSDYGTIASNAYGLDLLGAATGALLFTIYIIPLLGFGWSVVVTGLFNLLVVLFAPK